MSGKLIDACIRCRLTVCNKQAAGCEYNQILKRWNGEDYEYRKDYHSRYYQANKDRKLAAANARNARLRAELA